MNGSRSFSPGRLSWLPPAVFFLALFYPSLGLFKNLPESFIIVWFGAAAASAWFWFRVTPPLLEGRVMVRHSWAATAFLLVLLGMAFAWVHPRIDTAGFSLFGRVVGAADADDAIEVGLDALLDGRYPYRDRTFLGNPLTPLPGSLLLGLPFHLMGNAAWQNLFWLALFLGLFRGCHRLSSPSGVMMPWLLVGLFGLSPVLLYQILQGTDYWSNAVFVLLASFGMLNFSRSGRLSWRLFLCSLALGVALASRLNFLISTPVLFMALVQSLGWRTAFLAVLLTAITFGLLTVPFYLADPDGFAPLHTVNKLDPLGNSRTLAFTVPVVGVLLAFALGKGVRVSSCASSWALRTFLVQAFLLAANFVIGWLSFGTPPWGFANFGVLALPFACWSLAPSVFTAALQRNASRDEAAAT